MKLNITIENFNPDNMSIEDLEELYGQINNTYNSLTKKSCEISTNRKFLGSHYGKNNKEIMNNIRGYIATKLAAMYNRKNGDIQAALGLEKQCDQIYEKLPEFARW